MVSFYLLLRSVVHGLKPVSFSLMYPTTYNILGTYFYSAAADKNKFVRFAWDEINLNNFLLVIHAVQ